MALLPVFEPDAAADVPGVLRIGPGRLAAYGAGDVTPSRITVEGGTLLFGETADAGAGRIDVLSGRTHFLHPSSAGCAAIHVWPDGALGFEAGAQAVAARIRNDGCMQVGSMAGAALQVGSLRGSGAVHLESAVLEVGSLGRHDLFSGSLSDGCRGAGLRKTGAGTLTLAGTCLYRGPTRVDGGCLRVDGSLHGSEVLVGAGASLAGGGAISKSCLVAPGGRLAPAGSGRALQLGDLRAQSGAVLAFGLAPGGLSDRVDVGELSLEGAVLDLFGVAPAARTALIGYARLRAASLSIGALPAGLRREDVRLEFGDHALWLVVAGLPHAVE